MYFLAIIQNYSIPAFYSYQTRSEAMARFHSELAYRHESRTSTVCILYDQKGNELEHDYYDVEDIEGVNAEE